MKKVILCLVIVGAVSCQDDNLPPGFYDHQIVRLLAGGNAPDSMKSWIRTSYSVDGVNMPLDNCTDSVRLLFKIIQLAPLDSINCYELTPTSGCNLYDTVIYGGMTPSSVDNFFTDSLLFDGGSLNYILVDQLTSLNFSGRYQQAGKSYRFSYQAIQ